MGELAGLSLLCHCTADEQCHGDVLVDLFSRAAGSPSLGAGRVGEVFAVVELFAGLMPVSVAVEQLGLRVAATYASEICPDALHVAAHNFPEAVQLGDVRGIDREVVRQLVQGHPGCSFLLGGRIAMP